MKDMRKIRVSGTWAIVLGGLMIAILFFALPRAAAEVDWDEEEILRGRIFRYNEYHSRLLDLYRKMGVEIVSGENARVLWRRAMGPFGSLNDMGGPWGPDGLKRTVKGDKTIIQGGNFRLLWLASRGGEICDVRSFNGRYWWPVQHHQVVRTVGLYGAPRNTLIPVGFRAFRADTMPNFVVESPADYKGNTPLYFLGEDKTSVMEVTRETADEIHLSVTGYPATFLRGRSPMRVEQKYHIYKEGIVFSDFSIALEGDETFTIREFGLGLSINDTLYTELYEDRPVRFMSRMGKVGAVEHSRFFKVKKHKIIEEHKPYFGMSFGMPGEIDGSYSNALDMVLEDSYGFNQEIMTKPFYERFDPYSLRFFYSLGWGLHATKTGAPLDLDPGFAYSNRYGIGLAGHRYGSRAELPRVMRNQLAGKRIIMWKNNGAAGQGASWYPTDEEIGQLQKKGMDVLILGIGWMKTPGVPGKTIGDYVPADGGRLKGLLAKCHALGIRVGLSMRGQEYFILEKNSRWITDFLQKDYDGVYVLETNFLVSPGSIYPRKSTVPGSSIRFSRTGDQHINAYGNFLWGRHLRKLVGEKGFLLGTSEIGPTVFSLAPFDAYVPSGQHADLMKGGRIDDFVYYSFINGCGSVIPAHWDKKVVAYGVGLGASLMLTINRREDIAKDLGAVGRFWEELGQLPREDILSFNGITEKSGTVGVRRNGILATVLAASDGKCLLVAANPNRGRQSAEIRLDAQALKIGAKTKSVELGGYGIKVFLLK